MFNLFKSKSQDMNVLIQEIHNSFNSEGDRLLEEARQIIKKAEQTHASIIIEEDEQSIATRLTKVGFHQAKKVTIITDKNYKKKELEEIKKINEQTAKLIQHYNFYYPQNRFINLEGVKRLCAKYNLIYGEVQQYIGDVPLENLSHIEKFKVREEDKLYYRKYYRSFLSLRDNDKGTPITYKEYLQYQDAYNKEHITTISEERDLLSVGSIMFRHRNDYKFEFTKDEQLLICAPQKDFQLDKRQEIKDFKIVPDPVVLHPVVGGYLIVTAWGLEAKDDQVRNANHN